MATYLDTVQVTNTFVGEVLDFTNVLGVIPFTTGLEWAPNYSPGLHLIASPSPISGPISDMFYKVTARDPRDGESVTLLDPSSQTCSTSTYHTGSGWDDGATTLGIGQAAWLNLVDVPEPCSLLALPVISLLAVSLRRRAGSSGAERQ